DLGHSVLGTRESVGALTRDQMHDYFRRRYVPANITVCITGQFEWDNFVGLVSERCSGWSAGLSPRTGLAETPGQSGFEVKPDAKVAQESLVWMLAGPPTESPLRYAADLLTTVLGDDPGGRLYWEIVDPGLAEAADMGFQECEGAGLYYVSVV